MGADVLEFHSIDLKHRSTFRDHQLLLDGTDLPPLIHALEDIRTL